MGEGGKGMGVFESVFHAHLYQNVHNSLCAKVSILNKHTLMFCYLRQL